MELDTEVTDVIFRVDKTKDGKGTVFALLPHECCNHTGSVTTYQHLGQHSSADYKYCIASSSPASEKEYANLKQEMEGYGYNFNVVMKQNYNRFLTSYYEVRGIRR
jgi:hypothetical protein